MSITLQDLPEYNSSTPAGVRRLDTRSALGFVLLAVVAFGAQVLSPCVLLST